MAPHHTLILHRAAAILLLALFSACGRPAELDALDAAPLPGTPPQILPLDGLIAQAGPASVSADPASGLAARAARLRARASAIQGPIGDPDTRARLLAANAARQP